jgi:hypothetical protein
MPCFVVTTMALRSYNASGVLLKWVLALECQPSKISRKNYTIHSHPARPPAGSPGQVPEKTFQ